MSAICGVADPHGGLAGCRAQFAALATTVGGQPAVFLDGPGGTQVPAGVVEAASSYLLWRNANSHGSFATSQATDALVDGARRRFAAFFRAESPQEIAFGANMTTLNYRLARTIARDLSPGDEIVITEMDHEANRAPWLALRDQGIVVREVRFDTDACELDMADFAAKVGQRTKVIAVGAASNAIGTVNDLAAAHHLAQTVRALLVVDAVHYVPHLPVDVQAIGCDFLLCSAYKFFGPHLGVLYGRRAAFERLRPHKLVPQDDDIPYRIETGTPNFEGIAGAAAALEFIGSIGGPAAIASYEEQLVARLRAGLRAVDGVRLYEAGPDIAKTPTVAFTVAGIDAGVIARRLGEAGIFAWDGDFYATTLVARLGLAARGGLVRLGLAPYNTEAEVDRTVAAVGAIVAGRGER